MKLYGDYHDCSRCGKKKPITQFYSNELGFAPVCSVCRKKAGERPLRDKRRHQRAECRLTDEQIKILQGLVRERTPDLWKYAGVLVRANTVTAFKINEF